MTANHVLLMYTFLYLNFYFIVKCIYDSVVADRSIFGKGIFFFVITLVYWLQLHFVHFV